MDVKLKVLGGAKAGLEIPLKKDEFTIGRSTECSLRAGSDAISRRHCAIRVGKSEVSIRDLGSRNGTFVNGERIDEETTLKSGDEVRVGPLRFEVVAQHGIDTRSRSPVKSVAQAASRSAGQSDRGRNLEEDIDHWLTAPAHDSQVAFDTTTLRLDETQSGRPRQSDSGEDSPSDSAADEQKSTADEQKLTGETDQAQAEADPEGQERTADDSSIRRKDKKEPGKLPTRPKGPSTKDSREAAAEVLRAMTRRR